jgi:hypothetical protein
MKKQICVSLFALLFISVMPLSAMEPVKAEQRNGKYYVVLLTGSDKFVNGNKKQMAGTVVTAMVGAGLGLLAVVYGRGGNMNKAGLFAGLGALAGSAIGTRLGIELGAYFFADAEAKVAEKQS